MSIPENDMDLFPSIDPIPIPPAFTHTHTYMYSYKVFCHQYNWLYFTSQRKCICIFISICNIICNNLERERERERDYHGTLEGGGRRGKEEGGGVDGGHCLGA